jgi:hypothetical protein
MSEELPYSKGTIKLTWINQKDNTILESAMYKSVDEALKNVPKNIKKGDFLIFELASTDGVQYKWKLLPYGRYSQYKYGMEFFDNDLIFYGAVAFGLFGVYSLLKVLKVF